MSTAPYALRPTCFFVKDAPEERRDSLLFHLEVNDYFGTLAAVMSLLSQHLAQPLELRENTMPTVFHILRKIESDLEFLQDRYSIVEKNS